MNTERHIVGDKVSYINQEHMRAAVVSPDLQLVRDSSGYHNVELHNLKPTNDDGVMPMKLHKLLCRLPKLIAHITACIWCKGGEL